MALEVRKTIKDTFPYYFSKEFYFFKDEKVLGKLFYDKNGLLAKSEGAVPDGTYNEMYLSGKLRGEWPYQKQQLEGTAKIFYESGNLQAEIDFKNGRRDGTVKIFYENGTLKSECHYIDERLNGLLRQYYPSGKLIDEITFKDGKPVGGVVTSTDGCGPHVVTRRVTEKYPNGRTKTYVYSQNDADIAHETLDAKGQVTKTDGTIPDGVVREFTAEGILKGEWNYTNGKPNGLARTFYDNGCLEAEINYKDGKKDGPLKVYHECGLLTVEAAFENGILVDNNKYVL